MIFSALTAQLWELAPKSFSLHQVSTTLVLGIASLVAYFFLKYAIRRHLLGRKLPGKHPGFLSIWGNLREIEDLKKNSKNFNAALLEFVKQYSKEFGKNQIFCVWISFVPFVLFVKAEALEELIAGTRTLKKSWVYNFLHPWLGTGLLTSSGQKWKSRRKLLTPSFHFDILKEYLPIFNEQSEKFVKILYDETPKDSIDIIMPVTLCSLDIICETTLGVKINAQEDKDSEYVKAVLRAANIIAERMLNAKYWFEPIFRLTEAGRQHKADLKLLHEFTKKVIYENKQKMLNGDLEEISKKKRKSLMHLLLEHHLKTKDLTEEDIREEVDTFTFEGHDTTSMGISWALYLIGLYKDVQENLHQEMDRIFGDDIERQITTEDIKDMTYLDCVLKESQRLYPSVPYIAREATQDLIINGFKIPKGTTCSGITYQLHRDEEVFPDPEKFDPDRFLPENSVNRHPYAYIPFSAGPRNCIGQRFAVMEEKVVVANILRNFTLRSLDSRDKLTPAPELILRVLEPLRIQIKPRRPL